MTSNFDPHEFEQTFIGDKVPVFYKKIDTAPCIHIRIVFDYGSFHDEKGKEGIAHFLEHMLFNGTALYEDKKAIEVFNKKYLLNTLNANTSFFELKIVGKCLPENFEKAIEGIFSMVLTPKFDQKDFDDEKKVIIQESWRSFLNDRYLNYVKKYINNNDSIPDRKRMYSALGWPDTIEKINIEDIKDAYSRFIVKENLKIFVAGNIDEDLLPILNKYIVGIRDGEKTDPVYIPENISENKTGRFRNRRSSIGLTDKKQTFVCLERVLPRIKDKEEEVLFISTMSIIKSLLYDIMHEKFRLENNWCYGVDTSFSISKDRFYIAIDSEINPDNEKEAIKAMYQILEDLKGDIYKDKFDQVKQTVLESMVSAERLTGDILDNVVFDYMNIGKITPFKKYLENTNKVTFKSINDFAKKNLIKEKMFEEIIISDRKKILGIF